MKKFIQLTLILVIFTLASCKSFLPETPPISQTKIDFIQEPVFVDLPEKTGVIIPKDTLTQTANETTATNKLNEEIILPKNTQIILKQGTMVQITEKESVILPEGTKVETQKTNWYAVVLYAGLIISGLWMILKREK